LHPRFAEKRERDTCNFFEKKSHSAGPFSYKELYDRTLFKNFNNKKLVQILEDFLVEFCSSLIKVSRKKIIIVFKFSLSSSSQDIDAQIHKKNLKKFFYLNFRV
jgi:hypothetical protein